MPSQIYRDSLRLLITPTIFPSILRLKTTKGLNEGRSSSPPQNTYLVFKAGISLHFVQEKGKAKGRVNTGANYGIIPRAGYLQKRNNKLSSTPVANWWSTTKRKSHKEQIVKEAELSSCNTEEREVQVGYQEKVPHQGCQALNRLPRAACTAPVLSDVRSDFWIALCGARRWTH